MAGKKGSKQITPESFITLKQGINALREAGVSMNQVGKVLNRSGSTIYLVHKSETFDEYKVNVREMRKPKAVKLPVADDPAFDTPPVNEDLTLLAAMNLLNENLALMAGKLEDNTKASKELAVAMWSVRKEIIADSKKKWF